MTVARVRVADCAWALAAVPHPGLLTDAATRLTGAGAVSIAVVGVGVTDTWEAKAKQQRYSKQRAQAVCSRSTMHGTAVVCVARHLLWNQRHTL